MIQSNKIFLLRMPLSLFLKQIYIIVNKEPVRILVFFQCSEAVSTYGKELIDAAVKYLADPSQLCSLLGLCNDTLSQVEAFENLRSISTVYTSSRYGVDEILPDNLKGISNCGLCEFVTSIIQGIFEDQPIQDFVHDELSKFCHLLPQSESVVCLEAIRELEPEMYMAFVKKYLNPTTFCPSIGICPPN